MPKNREHDPRMRAGHYILESELRGSTTYYLLRCIKCGYESWRTNGFLKAKAICPVCSGGRVPHKSRGFGNDPLYKRYCVIRRRAEKKAGYEHVTMCKEWTDNFSVFRDWALKNGYKDGLTIDRIDNRKGYSPDNCRWVTLKEQANNRRSNVIVDYDGRSFTLTQFAEYVGLNVSTIKQRRESGWSVEDMAKTPYKARKKWSEAV